MKRNRIKYILALLAIAISCQFSYAQKDKKHITKQHLLWFRYYNKLTLAEKWQLHTQVEDRTYFDPWTQHQFLARTQIVYALDSNIGVSQGFAFFLQNTPQDPEADSHFDVPEYRPYQEVIIKNELSKKFQLQNRLKLEERFFRNNDPKKQELLPGTTFNWRFRYQIQLQYIFFQTDKKQSLKAVVADEAMVNFGKQIVYNSFDQNRFTIGLAYDFSKKFGVEVDYIHWFQQRTSGIDYYSRNIGRFTIYHNIDLRKK